MTLLATLDEETGVLAIAKDVPYTEKRLYDDLALISDARLDAAEYRFTDDDLQAAIREYVAAKGEKRIALHENLVRFDPEQRIQEDGIDEYGRKYQVRDLDCGTAAVLALTLYAARQADIVSAMQAAADFLLNIETI